MCIGMTLSLLLGKDSQKYFNKKSQKTKGLYWDSKLKFKPQLVLDLALSR